MWIRSFKSPLLSSARAGRVRFRVAGILHLGLVALAAWHVYLATTAYLGNRFYAYDVGNINYALYWTLHGRFFCLFTHQFSNFACHFTPTLLLLAPLQGLAQHHLLIPLFETLALLSGAWATAWLFDGLTRRGRARAWALSPLGLAIGWLYATNVWTGSILLSYHFESFGVALLLWALAAAANRRWRGFWGLMLLMIGVKEDFALYFAVFGFWWIFFGWEKGTGRSLWHTRIQRAWPMIAVGMIGFCVGWGAIGAFARQVGYESSLFAPRYAWLGPTLSAKVQTVLEHPQLVWLPLWRVAKMTLWTTLFLPLLAPETLLLIVPGAYVMGLAVDFEPMFELMYYYSYPILPFLFLGVCAGLARLLRHTRRWRWRAAVRGILLLALTLAGCVQLTLPHHMEHQRRLPAEFTERHSWLRMVLAEAIPRDASVAIQYDLICQLPFRPAVFPLEEKWLDRAEFWVLDLKGFRGDLKAEECRRIIERGFDLSRQKKGQVRVDQDGLLIFQIPRSGSSPLRPAPDSGPQNIRQPE
jgi:uncharacterized membrane protein